MNENRSKTKRWLLAGAIVLGLEAAPLRAQPYWPYDSVVETTNVLADVIIVRPLSLVGTLAGTAIFLGISPFTALASIPPPHDAFPRVANILIGAPGAFTFLRPLGDFCTGSRFPYQNAQCW